MFSSDIHRIRRAERGFSDLNFATSSDLRIRSVANFLHLVSPQPYGANLPPKSSQRNDLNRPPPSNAPPNNDSVTTSQSDRGPTEAIINVCPREESPDGEANICCLRDSSLPTSEASESASTRSPTLESLSRPIDRRARRRRTRRFGEGKEEVGRRNSLFVQRMSDTSCWQTISEEKLGLMTAGIFRSGSVI